MHNKAAHRREVCINTKFLRRRDVGQAAHPLRCENHDRADVTRCDLGSRFSEVQNGHVNCASNQLGCELTATLKGYNFRCRQITAAGEHEGRYIIDATQVSGAIRQWISLLRIYKSLRAVVDTATRHQNLRIIGTARDGTHVI